MAYSGSQIQHSVYYLTLTSPLRRGKYFTNAQTAEYCIQEVRQETNQAKQEGEVGTTATTFDTPDNDLYPTAGIPKNSDQV